MEEYIVKDEKETLGFDLLCEWFELENEEKRKIINVLEGSDIYRFLPKYKDDNVKGIMALLVFGEAINMIKKIERERC